MTGPHVLSNISLADEPVRVEQRTEEAGELASPERWQPTLDRSGRFDAVIVQRSLIRR